jgi:hypothetical protein
LRNRLSQPVRDYVELCELSGQPDTVLEDKEWKITPAGTKHLALQYKVFGENMCTIEPKVVEFVRNGKPTLFIMSLAYGLKMHVGDDHPTSPQDFRKILKNCHAMGLRGGSYTIIVFFAPALYFEYKKVMESSNSGQQAGIIETITWSKSDYFFKGGPHQISYNQEMALVGFFSKNGVRDQVHFPPNPKARRMQSLVFPCGKLYTIPSGMKSFWKDQFNNELVAQLIENHSTPGYGHCGGIVTGSKGDCHRH